MGIANYMGLGRDRLIARGRAAQGVVTGTRTHRVRVLSLIHI